MKAKQLLDTIKNLDLRRFGKNEYTDAKNKSGGGSGEIDYEAIYQFYKKKLVEGIPEQYLEQAIIPEHYADIEAGIGDSEEYENKLGVWIGDAKNDDIALFNVLESPNISNPIYFGYYRYSDFEIL